MTNKMPLPSATEPRDEFQAVHVCMHADINEIEVGFVILIPGNLRLGPIEHSQTNRQQIVNKPGHRLISAIIRWSFLESKHRWTFNNTLHISLSSCSCLHYSEDLFKAPMDEQQFYARILALIVAVLCTYTYQLFN